MLLKVNDHKGRLYDANGVELKFCIWADMETGKAIHYVGEQWPPLSEINDDDDFPFKTENRQHPAPLRYVPLSKQEAE
jgi:hypothetical protein